MATGTKKGEDVCQARETRPAAGGENKKKTPIREEYGEIGLGGPQKDKRLVSFWWGKKDERKKKEKTGGGRRHAGGH